MYHSQMNSVRFVGLRIQDYGVFHGPIELEFKRHQTLIVGIGGTGKTTIAKVLANLGPVPEITAHSHKKHPEMFVEVTTQGNRKLIRKHSNLVLLNSESMPINDIASTFVDKLDRHSYETFIDEAQAIFNTIVPRTIESHKDLRPDIMPAGEGICLGYAFAFAARKVLNLDLPAVFDSPYGRLDSFLRNRVSAFLKEQSCQQILIGSENEFPDDVEIQYRLDYPSYNSLRGKTTGDDG